jgi:hypothetical protein
MQDVLFVLIRQSSQKLKLVPVARQYTFLPVITSQELVDAHLATYETWLVYLQKITEYTNLSCQHSQKGPHTLPFTIETVPMRLSMHGQCPTSDTLLFEWSASLPRIFTMWNIHVWQNVSRHRHDVGSHYNRSHPSLTGLSCGTTMYGKM